MLGGLNFAIFMTDFFCKENIFYSCTSFFIYVALVNTFDSIEYAQPFELKMLRITTLFCMRGL